MNLQGREQRAVRLGVMAAIAIVLYAFIIDPAWSAWSEVTDQLATVNAQITDAETAANAALTGRRVARELALAARLTNAQSPLNQHTALLTRQLQTLPSYADLRVQRLEAGRMLAEPEQGYARTSVSMLFACRMSELQAFLDELAAASPRLIVDQMMVTSDPKNPSQVDVRMVVFAFSVTVSTSESTLPQEARAR